MHAETHFMLGVRRHYNGGMRTQTEKAEYLRALHQGPEVLVLPNAWDCSSARIFEEAGFPAIATTSAGVAFAQGYPDGQRIPGREMLEVVRRIAACVQIPVTADLESGYENAAETAEKLIASGAVGLNLEDLENGSEKNLVEIEAQARKIAEVRRVGMHRGVPIVINARTDVYLGQIGEPGTRFERACERLRAYIKAGADCVFIPGIDDENLIRRFAEALRFPINILAGAATPPVARLKEIGIRRVSVGSGIARAAMGRTRRAAQELRATGEFEAMLEGAIPYAEANGLFKR